MGMTSGQFKSYIRLLMGDIKDVLALVDPTDEKVTEKLESILKDLQAALED